MAPPMFAEGLPDYFARLGAQRRRGYEGSMAGRPADVLAMTECEAFQPATLSS